MVNYNRIAWIYDFLANIVLGKKLEEANRAFLNRIPPRAKVLVVGGGTGKIIEYLDDLDSDINVDYVELSSKMTLLSKRRQRKTIDLNFYNISIIDLEESEYDVIIANFFFDQFEVEKSREILTHLKEKLKMNGFLILNDFIYSAKMIDKIIMFLMIYFFRLSAQIEIKRLPEYPQVLPVVGFSNTASLKISRNICASIYSVR